MATGNSNRLGEERVDRPTAPHSLTLTVPTSLIDSLMSTDPAAEAEAVKALRILMAGADNVEFLQRPIISKLVRIIGCEFDPWNEARRKMQLDAAWILTKVTASSSELTSVIGIEGGVRIFVRHLENESFEEMRIQSVWILGNIAGDSPARRDHVISQGVLPPLLHLISQNTRFKRQENVTHVLKLHPVRLSVWCLSNLCRVSPGPPPHFASLLPSLPVLARMLQVQDREILRDACFAFASLADGSHEKIQSVINSGVVPRLVNLLQHTSKMVVASALRAVGNILLGDDSQTQFVIDNGGLPALLNLLLHDNEHLRRDACRATSNVTAGNAEQIQAVMDAEIFPLLIALMHTPTSVGVDVEAGWALLNVGRRGRPDQLEALKAMGCDTRIFTLGLPLPLPRSGFRGGAAGNNGLSAAFGGLFPLQYGTAGAQQRQPLFPSLHPTPNVSTNAVSSTLENPPVPPVPSLHTAGLQQLGVQNPPPQQVQQDQEDAPETPPGTSAAAAAVAALVAEVSASPHGHDAILTTQRRRRLSASTLTSSTTSSPTTSNVASNASMLPNPAVSATASELNSLLDIASSDTVMIDEEEDEGHGASPVAFEDAEDGAPDNADDLD